MNNITIVTDSASDLDINLMKEYNIKFDYNILAYVIMGNHYHLLIQSFKDPIGEVMFNINNVCGKFIRDNLNRSGHVFQGRYNSKLVQTNGYFLWLLRYIHRNPVRAKICARVEDYKWSSHNFYSKGHSNFVNVEFSLSIFNPDRRKAALLYLELMNSNGCDESSKKDLEFFQPQLNQYDCKKIYTDTNLRSVTRTSIQEIVNSFNLLPEDILLLTSGSRKRHLTNIKMSLIRRALEEKYTISEIASYFNISQPAISKLIKAHNKL